MSIEEMKGLNVLSEVYLKSWMPFASILAACDENGQYNTFAGEENTLIGDVDGSIYICNLTTSTVYCRIVNGYIEFMEDDEEQSEEELMEAIKEIYRSILPEKFSGYEFQLPDNMISIKNMHYENGYYEIRIPYVDDEILTPSHKITEFLNHCYPNFCTLIGDEAYEEMIQKLRSCNLNPGYERVQRAVRIVRRYNTYTHMRAFVIDNEL